jgi:pimeloyl-ACP methyl ester carboxylesterase
MKVLGRLLVVVGLLILAGALLFWRSPIWFSTQATHADLFFHNVKSNYVLTPEGRVHYYEAEPRFAPEHGIPLVLVHGLGDRDESWAPMLKRLKKAGFHVYAPDLLGYGRSPKPADGDYSIAGQERYLADFIQALGLPQTDLGGWSMGGWITLKLALDQPEMVNRVVVYDSAGLQTDATPVPASAFHTTSAQDVQALFHLMEPEAKPLPEFYARDAARRLESVQPTIDANIAGMRTGKDFLNGSIAGLKEPLLIVWGGTDHLVPLSVGQQLHALVPGSELDIVEGCGHLAPSHCSGRVSAATADFLKADPPPQGSIRTLAAMGR